MYEQKNPRYLIFMSSIPNRYMVVACLFSFYMKMKIELNAGGFWQKPTENDKKLKRFICAFDLKRLKYIGSSCHAV